jgi:hypothetical protein
LLLTDTHFQKLKVEIHKSLFEWIVNDKHCEALRQICVKEEKKTFSEKKKEILSIEQKVMKIMSKSSKALSP